MATAKRKPTEKDLKLFENPLASTCEHCGMEYDDFKTGETYQTIYDTLWTGSNDPEDWVYKRRGTVLGRWHALKQGLWMDHIQICGQDQTFDPSQWDDPIKEGETIEY